MTSAPTDHPQPAGTMTVTYDPRSPHAEDGLEQAMSEPCQACGHLRSSHDKTSTRFCGATLNRALDRACLCNPPAEPPTAPMYGRGRFSGR